MNTKSRNQLHEDALKILYCALTYENMNLEYDLKEISEDILSTPYADIDLYVRLVTTKALIYQVRFIPLITPHLRKWRYERLSRLTRAIILLACAHFYEVEEVDKGIVINNAVRLAKTYLDDGEYKFINGLLDQVLKHE